MLGKTHVLGAAVTGAALGLPAGHTVAMAVAAAVTGKLPDIDRMLNSGPNHRSLTHSMVFAGGGVLALAYYVCSQLPDTLLGMSFIVPVVVWGLAIGYFSHLLLDSFTSKRVPLLFKHGPSIGLGIIKTGTAGETLFTMLMMLATALYLVVSYGGADGTVGTVLAAFTAGI